CACLVDPAAHAPVPRPPNDGADPVRTLYPPSGGSRAMPMPSSQASWGWLALAGLCLACNTGQLTSEDCGTDLQLCTQTHFECSSLSMVDTCGQHRLVQSCGQCAAGRMCGGQTPGRCSPGGPDSCLPESDAQLCSRLAVACGPLSAEDNCG